MHMMTMQVLNELLYKNTDLKVIMSNEAMQTLKRGQNSLMVVVALAWLFANLWHYSVKQNTVFLYRG